MHWTLYVSVTLLPLLVLILLEVGRSTCSLEARRKGEQLLLANLTPAQRRQFETYRHFDAVGSATGQQYRIFDGRYQNVFELRDGRRGQGRCFMPTGDLVAGDCMLAQKIAIENYEDEMLRTAVRF
jgi:hypothetical protein